MAAGGGSSPRSMPRPPARPGPARSSPPTPHPPQVTSSGVRLVDASGQAVVAEWTPAVGYTINVAAGSPTQARVRRGLR